MKISLWYLPASSALIYLVFGFIIVLNPEMTLINVWVFTGVTMIVEGIITAVCLFFLERERHELKKAKREEKSSAKKAASAKSAKEPSPEAPEAPKTTTPEPPKAASPESPKSASPEPPKEEQTPPPSAE